MKFEKLQQLKQKFSRVKKVLDGFPFDLSAIVKDDEKRKGFQQNLIELKEENINLSHSEWQKKKLPNCTASISTSYAHRYDSRVLEKIY